MEDDAVDAVGLVRRIRDELYEKTKDMSVDELIAFYHRHSAEAKAKLSRLRVTREEPAPGRA